MHIIIRIKIMQTLVDRRNGLFDVNFDQHTRTFTCIILQHRYLSIENECSINISYGANCDHNLGAYRGNSTEDLIVISPIDFIEDIDVYCYTATAKISHFYTLGMIGNLTLQTTQGGSMVVAIVISMLLSIGVLTTIIIVIISVQRFWNKQRSWPMQVSTL